MSEPFWRVVVVAAVVVAAVAVAAVVAAAVVVAGKINNDYWKWKSKNDYF